MLQSLSSSSTSSSSTSSSSSLSSLLPSPQYHTSELDYMKQLAWNEFREKFSVDMTTCTSIKAKMETVAVVVTEKTTLGCTPISATNTNKNSKKEDTTKKKKKGNNSNNKKREGFSKSNNRMNQRYDNEDNIYYNDDTDTDDDNDNNYKAQNKSVAVQLLERILRTNGTWKAFSNQLYEKNDKEKEEAICRRRNRYLEKSSSLSKCNDDNDDMYDPYLERAQMEWNQKLEEALRYPKPSLDNSGGVISDVNDCSSPSSLRIRRHLTADVLFDCLMMCHHGTVSSKETNKIINNTTPQHTFDDVELIFNSTSNSESKSKTSITSTSSSSIMIETTTTPYGMAMFPNRPIIIQSNNHNYINSSSYSSLSPSSSLLFGEDKFREFDPTIPGNRHMGLHDIINDNYKLYNNSNSNDGTSIDKKYNNNDRFAKDHLKLGERVLREKCRPLAARYLRRGAHPSIRGDIWKVVLGLVKNRDVGDTGDGDGDIDIDNGCDSNSYGDTDSDILYHHLPTSNRADMKWDTEESSRKTLVKDDPDLFPFEEKISNVTHALLCDKSIPSCAYPFPDDLPFLVAPLAFVYENERDMYTVARELLIRYWSCIGGIGRDGINNSNDDDCKNDNNNSMITTASTLPELCRLFEGVLHQRRYDVFEHLVSLNVHPLRLAFPWMHTAFAKYLNVGETLNLWDRILGYDSLELLPILAVGTIMFRSGFILESTSVEEVEAIFEGQQVGDDSDRGSSRGGDRLKVVPLLQSCLFPPIS